MLTFPTMAEKALAAWRAKPGTHPFNATAIAHGGERADEPGAIVWLFDDDTRVVITGRGASYKAIAELP